MSHRDAPREPLPGSALSSRHAAELAALLGGLDRLDPILALPTHPLSADPPLPFGRYRLRARLGSGAQGIALLADDPTLGRSVVVKVPQPAVLTDPPARERFAREARAAARLEHPGIVPVLEADDEGDLPYLVVGYVPGPSLAAWLRAHPGPTGARDAVGLLAALAAAVQHAHERGVLHCDLTPANVLLAPGASAPPGSLAEFAPAVTDFGLARSVLEGPALSRTFWIAGTPLYMAPEQARGDRRGLTARTDVYALGAILYELLTGGPPFPSETADAVLARVLRDSPARPRDVNPAISRDLNAVCLKCLEKDPVRRYPSAAALYDDLTNYLTGRPTQARPVGPVRVAARWARRHQLFTGVIALAAVAWAAIPALVVGYSGRLATEAATRQAAEAEAEASARKGREHAFYAALERVRQRRADGTYSGWGDESLADLKGLAVTPPDDARPDLRSEAAAALAAVDLRPVRTLGAGFPAYAPMFSPDGTALALCGWHWEEGTHQGRVRVLDPATGHPVRELAFPIDPVWSARAGAADGCRAVAFSPDGRWLVAGTRGGQLVRWDLTARAPEPVVWTAHTTDHTDPRRVWVLALAFAPDGGTLYSSTRDSTRAWDVRNGWRPSGERRDYIVPSGSTILGTSFPVMRTRDQLGRELCQLDPRGGGIQPTAVQGEEIFAATRDGRLAAAIVLPDFALSLIATDPGAKPSPLRSPDRSGDERLAITCMGFNPDGSLLATVEEHARRLKLWDVSGGQLLVDRIVDGGSGRFAFAPDGRHLAITEGNRTVLYEVTGRVRETLAVRARRWTRVIAVRPDARGLFALSDDAWRNTELGTWDTSPGCLPAGTGYRDVGFRGARMPIAAVAPCGARFAFTTARAGVGTTGGGGDRLEFGDGTAIECEDVTDLRFAPDGRLWAADGHRIRVWTAPAWTEERPLENDAADRSAGVVFRAVAPGKTVSVVGRRDGRVCVLRAGGSVHSVPPPFNSAVTALGLSADEKRVLVGGGRGELCLLEASGRLVTLLRGAHRDEVTAVIFGPSGWLVTGSVDRTIKLWDAGLRPVLTLWFGGAVQQACLSSDGQLLTVLVRGERGVRRWRLDHLAAALADLGLPPGWP